MLSSGTTLNAFISKDEGSVRTWIFPEESVHDCGMQLHPVPFFEHQAGGHKPLHQLISDHLQSGKAERERTGPGKTRSLCIISFRLFSQEGSKCEMKSLHAHRKGSRDSALMQKVLTIVQSFLCDHSCCKYSMRKGRFSTAESSFTVTDVTGS